MQHREPVIRSIDAAVVHERDAGGDLVPTEWARLVLPPDLARVVPRADGGFDVELHVFALCKLTSHRPTIERLKRAANLARCPYTVIDPEDCG